MDLPESERTELPIELFEKIRRTIENLIQSHKQSWKNHRSDTNDESPVIGMGLRLHTVEEGNVDQFNAHYWNRPKKTYSLHGMKELSEITFFYKKSPSADPQSVSTSDVYTLYKGNIITHQHQDPTPILYGGIYRYMWEKPDLNEKTATEFLKRIEKIFDEEISKGKTLT